MISKRLMLVGLIVLLSGCSFLPTAAAPSPSRTAAKMSPSPTASPAADSVLYVRMTSSDVMWVETTTRVLRSTDRGAHWTDVTPAPGGEAGSFFAFDDKTAWFVTVVSGAKASDIYSTTDGGKSWARSGAAFAIAGVGSLDFVDRLHGWATVGLGAAAGSQGLAVLRSTDGGTSWTRIADTGDPSTASPAPSGLGFGCDKGSADFGSATVGLLPVECAGGTPYIYRTQDGGWHWTSIALPNPGATGGWFFARPVFFTANDVLLTGNYFGANPIPTVLVSHDAGLTWAAFRLPGNGPVDFESATSGWQLDDRIYATDDGGATWHPLQVPATPFKPSGMGLEDFGAGIVVAWSDTAIFRTDDGALSWRDVTPPPKSA